jgi:DNA-binding CsgD family transcriptional regulator
MPWEAAVADALAVLEPSTDAETSATDRVQPRPADRFDLTRREREILNLLCQRLTDREISDHLFISQRTVASHVSNILQKLGASNRREAAAISARHALF